MPVSQDHVENKLKENLDPIFMVRFVHLIKKLDVSFGCFR
jgi:hypothetical protein